jgi:phage terminase large subunit-like protein
LIPGYDCFRGAGAFYFDGEAADEAIAFFHECLTHIEGKLAGQPFLLEEWQQAVMGCLFGWKRKDDDTRRYREALLYVPRKNGKTPQAAGIALFVLFCDPEGGQQNICAAAEREQAALAFRHARGMVEQDAELLSHVDIYGGDSGAGAKSIVFPDKRSNLRVISAEAKSKHGGNGPLVIVDELHAQPNRDLVDVLETSLASANRAQPLLVHLTTSDYDRPSICNDKHDYACKVRDGLVDDLAFLPVIYEATLEDDWKDEKVWERVNPNLDISVSREYLRRQCTKAQEDPSFENTFKRLHLNIRTEQAVRWLGVELWDKCAAPTRYVATKERVLEVGKDREAYAEALKGKRCFGGLDLSSTSDITACVLLFPIEDRYRLLPIYWVPEKYSQREHRIRQQYDRWIHKGLIRQTPGNMIDYAFVRRDLNELAKRYGIEGLAVDRLFQGAQLAQELERDGFDVTAFGMGFLSMAAPCLELERLILAQLLEHGGCPVLRWMFSNIAVEVDAAGNKKPTKKDSKGKIDGIVATLMALGIAMLGGPPKASVYETRGLLRTNGDDDDEAKSSGNGS